MPTDAHNYMQSQIIQRNQGTQDIQWNQGYQGYSGYHGSYVSNVQNTDDVFLYSCDSGPKVKIGGLW